MSVFLCCGRSLINIDVALQWAYLQEKGALNNFYFDIKYANTYLTCSNQSVLDSKVQAQ